ADERLERMREDVVADLGLIFYADEADDRRLPDPFATASQVVTISGRGVAQSVRVTDPEWHVPILWRSEMRSILTGYLRDGSLTGARIARIMEAAEGALAGILTSGLKDIMMLT
ncbi:MAG: hypothetical protein ACREVY_01195, partial [Gammaproteobacteria bacterium]